MSRRKTETDRLREFHDRNGPQPKVVPADPFPEDQRGDAWEPPAAESEPQSGTDSPAGTKKQSPFEFPKPVVASALKPEDVPTWLWQGYLARGHTTLLSALWKAGKTTLLAHLLRSLAAPGAFCGQPMEAGKVLYVTEESESRWVERRDDVGIQDHVRFIVRPFLAKSSWDQWALFLAYLNEILAADGADLLVFDTIVSLWPVRDENDASQVQSALQPLWQLPKGTAILLVHHNRKSDGAEATATRGSGAFPGFVDTIVELRRFRPDDGEDCRRVLTGTGRWDCTPRELVVELSGDGYTVQGSRRESWAREMETTISRLLPVNPPGYSFDDVKDNWTGEKFPTKQRVLDALRHGVESGLWKRRGDGTKGSPFTYWTDAPHE